MEKLFSYIVHDNFGCESGCCGHNVYLCDEKRNVKKSEWMFGHPGEVPYEEWGTEQCKDYFPDATPRPEWFEVSNA